MMNRGAISPRCAAACLATLAVMIAVWHVPGSAAVADSAGGVRLNLTMREILQSDPPETTIVDTLGVSLAFERETTLRIGNAVLYITARPVGGPDGPSAVRLMYALFVTGPVPDQRTDAVLIEYGAPLVVDEIRGKGKSLYRLLIVPHPAPAPAGEFMPADSIRENIIPSTYYLFHLNPRSRAMSHFRELSGALQSEFENARDEFGITEPGRADYYIFEGPCADVPLDPRFDFAVDPSRNRIVARYDREYSGVEGQASLLLMLYRSWGYAPEFLALGAAGYLTSADFDVMNDRDGGRVIPLDSLAQTFTFKRQPFPASLHHAASFVHWLISSRGMAAFHDAYSRATDLSLERALWSVYGKTLKELETEWLAYLKQRRFSPAELYRWAGRAAAYHRYTEYYDLLRRVAAGGDSIPTGINLELGLAAGQLGRWSDAVTYLAASFKMRPNDPNSISLLAEALWANGQVRDAEYHLRQLAAIDSTDARACLLLGDIQQLQRRNDSAAALWRRGLAVPDPGPVAVDLLLRLGNYERRRSPDSSRAHLMRAKMLADRLLVSSGADPLSLIRCGEALLAADSTDMALSYLHLASSVADSPQETGRICIAVGQCHDLARRRQEAVRAYEYVFRIPSAYYDSEMAKYYINHIFKH
jgi:tetratricopeptide (TPR) repeat protein